MCRGLAYSDSDLSLIASLYHNSDRANSPVHGFVAYVPIQEKQ